MKGYSAWPLTPAEMDSIRQMARAGEGWSRIANTYHIGHGRLKRWLQEEGFVQLTKGESGSARLRAKAAPRHAQIEQLWLTGHDAQQIAEAVALSRKQVRRILLRQGYDVPVMPRRPPCRLMSGPHCNHCECILTRENHGWGHVCKTCIAEMLGLRLCNPVVRREVFEYQHYGVYLSRGRVIA